MSDARELAYQICTRYSDASDDFSFIDAEAMISAHDAAIRAECAERGWLIEWSTPDWTDSPHRWWAEVPGEYNPDCWTTDSNKATRYARKQDAEAKLAAMGWDHDPSKFASEHEWVNRAAITKAEGEADTCPHCGATPYIREASVTQGRHVSDRAVCSRCKQ